MALLMIATLAGVFFWGCERTTVRRELPPKAEAIGNPYLAAQRLLRRAGFEVRRFRDVSGLPWPPPPDATVLFSAGDVAWPPERAQKVLAWVRAGGHALVVASSPGEQQELELDTFFSELGLEAYPNEGVAADLRAETQAIFAEREGGALSVELRASQYWAVPERQLNLSVGSEFGLHVVELEEGRGFVTALTDDLFLENASIGERDHGEFVVRLLGLQAISRRGELLQSGLPIWFVGSERIGSPWLVVLSNTWRILVTLAVLIVAWLLWISQRFGARLPDPSVARRSLMEHVEAAGRFFWRQGLRDQLLEAERQAVLERVRQRHPGWLELAPAELYQQLARGAGLTQDSVAAWMREEESPTAESFIEKVQGLHKIANSL